MHGRLLWAGLSGVAALLFHGVALAQCTMDNDCKGDRVCEAGKCTAPMPPAPPPPDSAVEPAAAAPRSGAALDAATATEPAPAAVAPSAAPLASPPPRRAAARQPAAAPPRVADEPQVLRRNRPVMILGIVMASIGPLALLGSLAASNSQDNCDEQLEEDYPDHIVPTSQQYRLDRCDGYSVPLYVLGIGGGVLIGAGIPMIIYGAKTMPAKKVALELSPWASPQSGGLKLRLTL